MANSRRRMPLLNLLAERRPELGRKAAYTAVLCGEISVDGERIRDPKATVPVDAVICRLRDRFVGRGGEKLDAALTEFGIEPAGWVCLDAGASTGGFTDCLLSRGASTVHAVDVGYNQIAWKLRNDPRVRVRERTNLMELRPGDLEPPPDFAVADLSFRSLRGAAARLLEFTPGRPVLALAKPQFESPPEERFDGVVRSPDARAGALESLRQDLVVEKVWISDAAASVITGRKGNAEIFLLLSRNQPEDGSYAEDQMRAALETAHRRIAR